MLTPMSVDAAASLLAQRSSSSKARRRSSSTSKSGSLLSYSVSSMSVRVPSSPAVSSAANRSVSTLPDPEAKLRIVRSRSATPGVSHARTARGRPKGPRTDPEDERVSIPLDPVEAMRALLKVDPDSEPAAAKDAPRSRDGASRYKRPERS
jgi:hypothetical protein